MNRRKFLIGGGLVGGIGLFGFSNVSSVVTGSTRPGESPETIPDELHCDTDGVQRHWKGYKHKQLAWGDAESWALRVDGQSFDYGETATITLTNTSLRVKSTGVRGKYNFELYTDTGWQEVRVTERSIAIPDSEENHPPGGGFEWEIPLTEDGIQSQWNEVCPDLQSGRYRFSYCGFVDFAIAVAFDIHRETEGSGIG